MKLIGGTLEVNGLQITFHRTLRLPEDGKTHNLPPSLGAFPLAKVDDYKEKVPPAWREHGGIFFPLYQREAMWLAFRQTENQARALKVAAGKINAVSGTPWAEALTKLTPKSSDDPAQDYMVVPPQPWLDGFNVGGGVIRQFIAMPLGMKYTVEAQVTGEEKFGGIQLIVYKPKADGPAGKITGIMRGGIFLNASSADGFHAGGGYAAGASYGAAGMGVMKSLSTPDLDTEELGMAASDFGGAVMDSMTCSVVPASAEPVTRGVTKGMTVNSSERQYRRERSEGLKRKSAEMGLAQGGQMKQSIYADPYGVDAWREDGTERIFVHIVNSELWQEITGQAAPATPISAHTYTQHGYPWYALYDEHVPAVEGSGTLKSARTVGQLDQQHGFEGQQDDTPIDDKASVTYKVEKPLAPNEVRDGKW